MYYGTRRKGVSIEFNIGVIIVLGILFLLNLVTIIRLSWRSRGRSDPNPPALDRIASRLDMLEQISGNLTELSRLFLVPHARGGLGETLLSELLRTWLPAKSYETQHEFSNGARADAIVRLSNSLVAIDSKFPLEQVRDILDSSDELPAKTTRVFLKHIEEIAAKYIRPDEGTLEFALMYVPSEALYYRAFVDSDGSLMDRAIRKGVVPTGPSSLFLYLQTVAFGLRGLELPKNEREIVGLIDRLNRDFSELKGVAETTGKHVRNAAKQVDEFTRLLVRYETVLERLSTRRERE